MAGPYPGPFPGEKIHRLTVLATPIVRSRNGTTRRMCECICDCGNTIVADPRQLRSGATKSCGCWRRDNSRARLTGRFGLDAPGGKHGGSSTKLYAIFQNMHQRCENPHSRVYSWYGGRGIVVCDEWRMWESFRDWAFTNGYVEGLSIERRDSAGNYEPRNCEWITRAENARRATGVGSGHCRRGHERTTNNTYVDPTGRRHCRVCRTITMRDRRSNLKNQNAPRKRAS